MRTELKEVFDRDGETESLSLKDVPPEVLVEAATDLIFCCASLNDLLTWLCGLNSNHEPVSPQNRATRAPAQGRSAMDQELRHEDISDHAGNRAPTEDPDCDDREHALRSTSRKHRGIQSEGAAVPKP